MHSKEENSFVGSLFETDAEMFWLDGRYLIEVKSESPYKKVIWTDGTLMDFQKFDNFEPVDKVGHECLHFGLKWGNHLGCSKDLPFVCKKPKVGLN